MKYKGKKIDRPNREIIAIPRAEGEDIIFIAKAILSYDEFDKLVPLPKPGIKLKKGGERVVDLEGPAYKADMVRYSEKKYAWMILKSLEESPIEWETVNMGDPSTWNNWESELKKSGFSNIECNRIIKGISDANCLNEEKVEEARKRFLAGIELDQLLESSSLQPELNSTQYGEVVKPGESNHQASTEAVGRN